MVIEGEAVLNVDGAEHHLATSEATFVPAGIPHFFRNASETEKMRIFWTYASLDAARIAGGEARRIDEEPGHRGDVKT